MSIENLALKGSVWKSQPFKGLLFIVAIALISLVFELLLDRIFRLDVQSKLIYITLLLCLVASGIFSQWVSRQSLLFSPLWTWNA